MKSWVWREFSAFVFESKGLISKYSGIRTYEDKGSVLVPIRDMGCLFDLISCCQGARRMASGGNRRGVSGDGYTSSLANPISIFARGGLVVCDGGTASL